MKWEEIRNLYPHQWLLVEAMEACSHAGKRILEQLSVVQSFSDSLTAMERYKYIHHKYPGRELYVLHTDKESIDIIDRKWVGIRSTL